MIPFRNFAKTGEGGIFTAIIYTDNLEVKSRDAVQNVHQLDGFINPIRETIDGLTKPASEHHYAGRQGIEPRHRCRLRASRRHADR